MSLWTAKEIASATGGIASGEFAINRVIIDSREAKEGDLFIALCGENHDAHKFIPEVLSKGACVLSAQDYPDSRVIKVADTTQALNDLGIYARKRSHAKIIGITGSIGKTTTKEMLAHALAAQPKKALAAQPNKILAAQPNKIVYATKGNLNNHYGVPLTLANLPQNADYAVIEMGMNHAGEITHLSKMTKPHAALITAIEAVHTEFFKDLNEVAQAKNEICAGMAEDGILLFPEDSPYKHNFIYPNKQSFGESEAANYRLLSATVTAQGTKTSALIGESAQDYIIGAAGKHYALISVAILGLVKIIGADVAIAAQALENFYEPQGRGRIQKLTKIYLIDDSYNASPASMQAALLRLSDIHQAAGGTGRKIAVLGDMLELGEDSIKYHQELAPIIQQAGIDKLFASGDLMQNLWQAIPSTQQGAWKKTALELLPELETSLQAGDWVLVKGSHGSLMYKLADKFTEQLHTKQQ